MKNLLYIISLIFLISGFNFAQPTRADWQAYKGNSDDFVVEFPTSPKRSEIHSGKSLRDFGNLYKAYLNGVFYFVVACKSTDCPPARVVRMMTIERQNSPDSKFSEKTLDASTTETSFMDKDEFFHRIRQQMTAKTLYIVHGVSEVPDNPELDKFFNSFQIKTPDESARKIEKEKYDVPLVNDPPDPTKPPQMPAKPSQPGSQPATPETPPVAKTQPKLDGPMHGVSILNKPQAYYTEEARIYEITGEAWFRVVFSAKGEITKIEPWKKLPFGLTRQGILAAGQIKFNPAMRGGIPYSVTKPVVYKFTIY